MKETCHPVHQFMSVYSFWTVMELRGTLNLKIRSAVCLSGMLLGEIVKNLSKMAVADPKRRLKMMMLSAVSYLAMLTQFPGFVLS